MIRAFFRRLLTLLLVVGSAQGPLSAEETAIRTVGPQNSLLEQPKSEYKFRRQALMKRIREIESLGSIMGVRTKVGANGAKTAQTLIVLVGETEEPEDAKYRQLNDFAYLSGVETPRASIILWPDDDKETLYLPVRDKNEEVWTGPKIGPGPEGIAATGFDRVEPAGSFLGDLFTAVSDSGHKSFTERPATIYVIDPNPKPGQSGPSANLSRLLHDAATSSKVKNLSPILGELRKVKSSSEIQLLRKAITLTSGAQESAIRIVAPDVPEYRVEGAILGAFVSGGGTRAAFPSIVGSGLNSTVLHYSSNRRVMQNGDLVVIDIGAEYAYYAADITRALPVSGKFNPRQRAVYQLVLDCQTAAAHEFKLGVSTLSTQNRFAQHFFRDSSLRAKDDHGVERSMDHFFTHGLGHYLGMDVHDVGDSSKPFAIGEVFTIEPGLYIPSEGFGIRIEDDYLVTKVGLEKLSKDIPVEADEIERLMDRQSSKSSLKIMP